MISKSLFVIACVAIYVRAQNPCLHATENPHSFAASPLSCAHYTLCIGGNTIIGPELQCAPGMLFDPPSQTCGETSCLECSPFGIQNLPYPDDCYQYIECILGNRRFATCPNGLMFDRTVGQCNEPHLVKCPGQPIEPTESPTERPTEPTEPTTEPTEPVPTYTTDSFPTETLPPYPTEPPRGEEPVCRGQVFHAHPSDCTRFFMCIDEILWEHQCPSELHWNQLINACDFPEFARCLTADWTSIKTTTSIDPPLWPTLDEPWTLPNLLTPSSNE